MVEKPENKEPQIHCNWDYTMQDCQCTTPRIHTEIQLQVQTHLPWRKAETKQQQNSNSIPWVYTHTWLQTSTHIIDDALNCQMLMNHINQLHCDNTLQPMLRHFYQASLLPAKLHKHTTMTLPLGKCYFSYKICTNST